VHSRRSLGDILAHLFHPRRSNNHRPRVLHPEAYLGLSFIIIAFATIISRSYLLPGKFGHILGFASSITPSQVVEQTNQQRTKAGLGPLTVNDKLTQAALAKGQDMFNDQYWAHVAPDGTQPWSFIQNAGYAYSVAGENLARDFSNTADMMNAWMASPTHRANIMSSRYKEIGIAVIDGNLEGYDTTLVVQMFGTPKSGVAQLPAQGANQAESPEEPAAAELPTPAQPATTIVLETPSPGTPSVTASPWASALGKPTVLAGALVINGTFETPPLLTPLQLMKAFFLAVVLLLMAVLAYDALIMNNRNTVRVVGKNLAHLILLGFVAFLLILFKGGIVG
jgi:hypothetical protein